VRVAAAVSLKRSWPPVVLLALSASKSRFSKRTPGPGGPLTFGGMAAAAAWLEWEHSHKIAA